MLSDQTLESAPSEMRTEAANRLAGLDETSRLDEAAGPGQPAELDATPGSSDVWAAALQVLAGKISEQNFDLWFRPIRCASCSGQALLLTAPNRFLKEWFETHYLRIVLEEIERLSGASMTVSWQLQDAPADELEPPVEPQPRTRSSRSRTFGPSTGRPDLAGGDRPDPRRAEPARAPERGADRGADRRPDGGAARGAERSDKPAAASAPSSSKDGLELLPKYTFDSFVIGPSNQLAAAASRAVADNPGGKYNPLFIYGGVGLGKTHLLHAIGHQIQAQHPSWRILYLKTETFMNEYINQVRTGRIEEFRAKYRDSTDVLLMDDIQYLGGKERTQDEFFHTFNALFESHRQIVVTADKYPHEIPDLEERIRSRFQWGLIADIQAPELETRIAILQKKAEYDKIDLPSEVSHYLAAHIKSNVRELEGLLIRVAAFASLQQRPITVEFVQETLKNFLSTSTANLTVEAVLREVANYFNVKIADLKGTSRHASVTRPRQIGMYLSRKLCKASFPEIGQKFGGKDHTTVMSACRRVESLLVEDPKVRSMVQEIERHLSA